MRFTSTALVAGLAALTNAFLVPPNLPEDINDARWKGAPPGHFKDFVHALLEQKTTTIDLACPGCPFAAARLEGDGSDTEGGIVWEQGIENVIRLEFDTHDHSFNVNGHPLLPLEKAQQAQSTVIKAYQMRKDNNEQSIELPLNFAMEVMPSVPSPYKDDVSLIPIEFTVLGINGLPVKVNTISLKLIEPPTKDLVIVHTEEIPFMDTPGAVTCENARPWSICRLRAIVLARIKTMMGMAREKTAKVQEWVKGKTNGCGKHKRPASWRRPQPHREGDHQHPHHRGGHHGHHRHHRDHRLGHMLHQTFRFFVIPALLGVIGGLAACAIGMLVGQAIVFVWFKSYRRGQRGPHRLAQQEVAIVDDEKNELLVESADTLPVYEDAPKCDETMSRDVEADAVPLMDEKH